MVFDDITERGSCLTVERRLPPNEGRARVELYGDRFYCQAGEDNARPDTLFVFRVENVQRHQHHSVPTRYEAGFELWFDGASPCDSVEVILGDKGSGFVSEGKISGTERPSARLLRMLGDVPGQVRKMFRPGCAPEAPEDAEAFLRSLRAPWIRHTLGRYVEDLLPRQEKVLSGQIRPASLEPDERNEFLALYGFGLLNRLALDLGEFDELSACIESVGGLSISEDVRGGLWANMLSRLSTSEIRAELHESLVTFGDTASTGIARDQTWPKDHLIPVLRALALRNADKWLEKVVDVAEHATDVLGSIVGWVRLLEFTEDTVNAPGPVETPVDEPVPGDQGFEEWVMGLAGSEQIFEETQKLAKLMRELFGRSSWGDWGDRESIEFSPIESKRRDGSTSGEWRGLTGPDSLKAWGDLVRRVKATTEVLPEASSLEELATSARPAWDRAKEILGPALLTLVRKHTLGAAELDEIAGLLEEQEWLSALPAWLWDVDVAPSDVAGQADALVDENRRERIALVVARLRDLDEPAAAQWLTSESVGEGFRRDVDEWFAGARELLNDISLEERRLLFAGVTSLDTAEERKADAVNLVTIRERVSDTVYEELRTHLGGFEDPGQKSERIRLLRCAVDFVEEQFGDARQATSKMLVVWSESQDVVAAPGGGTHEGESISIEHNWINVSNARAQAAFYQPDETQIYGWVYVPIVLTTTVLGSVAVDLDIDVGRVGEGWPKEWPGPTPNDTVTIPVYRWRKQQGGKYHFTVTLGIPMRPPKSGDSLEVTVTARDSETQRVVGRQVRLRWDTILPAVPPVSLTWPASTDPQHVREHPIGPQAEAQKLENALTTGNSFAVVAPRRFGKSTLAAYLRDAGEKLKFFVPQTVVCTSYADKGGYDHEALWDALSEDCQEQLGVGIPRTYEDGLPVAGAFDKIRRRAKEQGYKRVVLLFDEAQLLFPSHSSAAHRGTRLKDLLEQNWSQAEKGVNVPLLVGLIGLPSLVERGGVNLMGLLSPREYLRLREEELRKLIPRMTEGLQTTREVRERLTKTSGNLYILRVLLDRLTARVSAQGRGWANFEDVSEVEDAIKRDLRAGEEKTVAAYIRDSLNSADEIDDWKPVDSFPVAAALALSDEPGKSWSKTLTDIVKRMNQWCQHSDDDAIRRFKYDTETVERHLTRLRERRVIDDARFTSPLLEAWLSGVAGGNPTDNDEFRDALLQGAELRLRVPSGAEKVAQGGQARILRFQEDGRATAYRIKPLSGPNDPEFNKDHEVFKRLRTRLDRRLPGSECIFNLREVGVTDGNPAEAVQVYDWVDGQDLSHHEGNLGVGYVVEIGRKLARALALLHDGGMLHRDIRPKNIILDDERRIPTLIDFGFAGVRDGQMDTQIGGGFAAPEVCQSSPKWTPAADIYSLGSTLRSVLSPTGGVSSQLASVLDAAMADDMESRPSAHDLIERLEDVTSRNDLNELKKKKWRKIQRVIEPDKYKDWFTKEVTKSQDKLVGIASGDHRKPMVIYRSVASFLNQVAEACPAQGLSLAKLDLDHPESGDVRVLWALRNVDSHGGTPSAKDRTTIRDFESKTRDGRHEVIMRAAKLVRLEIKVECLEDLLSFVLQGVPND